LKLNKMETININLTEKEIQTLLDESLTGELHEVFEWNFTSDKGNKINLIITVNDEEV
tara:strand:- start:528 stop:701 length:174 start_codon:yes stop_codon:yes gene_type:complete